MKKFLLGILIGLPIVFPESVSAHAFGVLYNLPVPFWLYLYGAAGALIVSFLVIGYFVTNSTGRFSYPERQWKLNFGWLTDLLKILSIIFWVLAIFAGFLGTQSPVDNFNMTFFWVIFLLGLTYLVAIFGDLWDVLNPWKISSEWLEKILGKGDGLVKYPKRLGYLPALLFYFILIWLELFGVVTPLKLSLSILIYTILNFLGIILVGRKDWFEYFEFFSVFFKIIAKISPVEKREGKIYLRPPFVGAVKNESFDISLVIFILFMLSSTAFDGFHSTIPAVRFFEFLGGDNFQIIQKLSLFLAPFLYFLIYIALMWVAKILTSIKISTLELSKRFAFSLIPIAFVYNFAHYFTLLLTQGQDIIRIISDPFGLNWNLFGTADYSVNLAVINAGFVWHTQVAAILIGHIAAVLVAHIIALEVFPSHKKALLSQIPMLILMVMYTVSGLWILSQPITTGAG